MSSSEIADLAETLRLDQIVPAQYAAYLPLVQEAVGYFLERLSPNRLMEIVGAQVQLPNGAGAVERIIALLHCCPTLHKLGQVMARDRRLAPELRCSLQELEMLAPTVATAEIAALIRAELGHDAPVTLGQAALAEASVAVVIPFTCHQPPADGPSEGVFKILKPGVESRLREELDIWAGMGSFLERECIDLGLLVLDYRETLQAVSGHLLNEIRLDGEQEHLASAARFHAANPAVQIPRLLPFCTPRMTAMERVYGDRITEHAGLSQEKRDRLAAHLVNALLAQPFWSTGLTATFHGDPHAGNLFLTRDERVAVLDWSLVSHLGKPEREAVVQIVLGAFTQDEVRICHAIETLCRKIPNEGPLPGVVAKSLRQVRWGTFPGLAWVVELMDAVGTNCGAGFSEHLTVFRKALHSLSGVLEDLSAAFPSDRVLVKTGALRFMNELGSRALTSVRSRDFGTHLSSQDLLELWAFLPFSGTRLWLGCWDDLSDTTRRVWRPVAAPEEETVEGG